MNLSFFAFLGLLVSVSSTEITTNGNEVDTKYVGSLRGQTQPRVLTSRALASLSTLDTIKARGYLACGVVLTPGLSVQDSRATWSGFEVDLCRAIAAAIFGTDNGQVNFTATESAARFTLLQSGAVDVVAAVATATMERDLNERTTKVGFSFSAPYLYNGLQFAGVPKFVSCAEKRSSTGSCAGLKICVVAGTTHVPIVQSLFSASVVIQAATRADFYANFSNGLCNVLASEQFQLAKGSVTQAGYNGSYTVGTNLYSKEPIALVTRDDDAGWSDFVNWVVLALLIAEEQSITKVSAQVATGFGLDSLFYKAVATVGNYGELYSTHLQSIVPRTKINRQNDGTTPVVYAFPYGNNTSLGPAPIAGGTLAKILKRGTLRCGTDVSPFFGNYNSTTKKWSGYDVDYCRAVSAAIFNGKDKTVFVQVDAKSRWTLLQNGTIDLLSRDTTWTYARDVNESSTGAGFTFTQPTFYTGLQFGGIPTYQTCAEKKSIKGSCASLKICVSNGTTLADTLVKIFGATHVVPQPNNQQILACLSNKQGNVIAGDGFFTSASNVKSQGGYTGSYRTSSLLFSRENLAVVTKQDDLQWSSFVNWVIISTFYADEQNITKSTYTKMPTTNLFGSGLTNMFKNAIKVVGSHNEILKRNAGSAYVIGSINRLNKNPYGPEHYPPSGILGLN